MIFPEQKKDALDGLVDQPEIPHRLNLLFHTLCVQAAEQNRTEQNIYFIDVNCTVSCQIHEYNNKFTNGHNRCIHDLTTMS